MTSRSDTQAAIILIEEPEAVPVKDKKLSIRIAAADAEAVQRYGVNLSALVRNLLRQYIALKEAANAAKK